MAVNFIEIRHKGREVWVPSTRINDRIIIVMGKWIRMATVKDEDWLEGGDVPNPDLFITELKEQTVKADIFAFSQCLLEIERRYPYKFEWDNFAAIPLTNFEGWWEQRLPQETRKNVRRAGRRGVIVRPVELNDELIQGIADIYNSTPILQGVPNAHYGKDFYAIKNMISTFPDTSQFLGAYCRSELIGFIKLVYMGKIAGIMHIVSKNQHNDKRPTNALIAEAVRICCQNARSYLVYGKYTYGNKTDSPLTEFKRRNGFEKILIPRYYIPLTLRGKIAVKLKLHRGLLGLLPSPVISLCLNLRAKLVQFRLRLLPKHRLRLDGVVQVQNAPGINSESVKERSGNQ